MAAQEGGAKLKSLRKRLHGFDRHKPDHCPTCVLGLEPMEPYMDPDGTDVDCSRCFDARIVCLVCEKEESKW